jgi:uncharacterized protein
MRPASIQTPRERASDAALARLVQYVRETVQPQRIVLFGSRATGRADAESDYDLLVVVDEGAGCTGAPWAWGSRPTLW